ncbi:FAD-dependent oxidoreductase [Micromonospora sp. KC213]|uniref:FAD-dependent oxidoreductase n=1 Tax=Micromonospora sp. KC213 TaxID=2530378 RepID=UPI001042D4A2|nr:FAD-dependent oxidoreductase [Micromonospora sp. KC213]TDC42959.1 FAD-binding monooxygenase [Micromonospora sp. KC213]
MGEGSTRRVVVLGASMGGLLAARVLADRYAEVLLVDRDEVTGVSGYRPGVPHGRHAHGLVARGYQILESQFPGLTDDLRAAGVVPGDFSGDIRWYVDGQRMLPSRSGLVSVPATRPVLEHAVRNRVQAIPNVRVLERHDIVGLVTTPDRARVIGARVQRRAEDSREEVLDADLVVDATGRGSRTPAWLAALGYQRPAEDRVKIDLAYTTRHFRLPEDPFGSDLAIIPAATPTSPRGAFFYRVPGDGGVVELTLTGILGDYPPADPEGFLAFVRSLPVPDIYRAVQDAEPVDDAVTFRFPASVRRRYERLTRFPAGLLVMGDAVCSFNPIYAQGMTAAALGSLVLAEHLRHGEPQPVAFFRDLARQLDSPWDFSGGADLGYAGVEGKRTAKIRFANAYVARLQRAATRDARLTDAFIRVAGLIDPPSSLMRPATMLRVLRHGRPRATNHTPARPGQLLGGRS